MSINRTNHIVSFAKDVALQVNENYEPVQCPLKNTEKTS
jgi:hypothetical protein